jgi:arylsulfatase A-like enzyme
MWGELPSDFEASSENLLAVNAGQLELTENERQFVTAMYDAGIRYTDRVLRDMFSELEAAGFFEKHIVLITSDHGEELGERGAYLHRELLYDDLIRVPLILRGARIAPGSVRSELVSSVDIAPTLLAYAGIDVEARMEGRDLLSEESPTDDAIFTQYESQRYAIRTPEWKLIVNTSPASAELYDLRADPHEREDVFARHPETVRALERRLREWRSGLPRLSSVAEKPEIEITVEQLEQLRRLGYFD